MVLSAITALAHLLFLQSGCKSTRIVSLKAMQGPASVAKTEPVSENTQVVAIPPVSAAAVDAVRPMALPGNPFRPASHVVPVANQEEKAEPESIRDAVIEAAAIDKIKERVTDEELAAPKDPAVEEIPTPMGSPVSNAVVAVDEVATEVSIDDVIISATSSFPAIREASLLRSLAIGNQIAAMGEFDDKLEAYSLGQPLGFYENYRQGAGWKKPLWMGGTAYSGYSIGRGEFEPWFGERETNEGGEFKAGFDMPLLQNRAIDPRRTQLRLASLDIQRSNPELFQEVLMTQYDATTAYWMWFSAAKQYEIQIELMELAEERVDRIETQIQAGDVARIVGIDNRRLLAMRRAKMIESRQKLDSAAIKLSLYFRNEVGRPMRPLPSAQPKDFPSLPTRPIDINTAIVRAMDNRPELAIFTIMEEQVRTELQLAINQRLPELNFGSEISQDVGALSSSKGDKQPFKLEAGLIGSVPVQRRKAIGKAQALRAKLGQIDAKRQLTGDKIVNEVRLAATVHDAAIARLEQARLTKELAEQTLNAGEVSFALGDIDILLLNIYEQAFADAGIEVINAQADLLTAEALVIIATGRSLLADEVPPPFILENIP